MRVRGIGRELGCSCAVQADVQGIRRKCVGPRCLALQLIPEPAEVKAQPRSAPDRDVPAQGELKELVAEAPAESDGYQASAG